jgi:outer membrane receptor protein involved in Fe transport
VHQPQRADELQVEDDVTQFFAPERADQLSLGVTQRIGTGSSLRLDAYQKRYDDLRPRFENLLDPLELVNEAEPDRVRIDAARARAHGVELSWRSTLSERAHAWLSYVYSRGEDQAGGWRPRLWDQEHAVTGGYAWAGERWRFSVAGNWHSGWPTTPVTVVETVDQNGDPLIRGFFGERNSARLGSFSRIDLRASRSHRFDSGTLTWYFEVYNLLDSKNPCCVEDFNLVRDAGGALRAVPNHDYWLPILPSFGVQFEF